jgi:uncharacterized short protein YbdD (DUF466 family)
MLKTKLQTVLRHAQDVANLMVGIKSYEAYLAHAQTCPHTPIMSREAFFKHCQEARYGGKGTSKCPC